MNIFQSFAASVTANVAHVALVAGVVLGGLRRRERGTERGTERGDVPGWVLITLMTAGLVTILWALAADQLTALFTAAMTSVTGP
jgi:hypothetical protein